MPRSYSREGRRSPANDNLDTTIKLWRQRLGRDLSREDARQIIEDVASFFDILTEWAKRSVPANDNGEPQQRVDRDVESSLAR